jgi:hypothetical protein
MNRLIGAAVAVAVLIGSGSAGAAKPPIDSYCSPSGDYCQGLIRQKGVRAKLSTFSFRGSYGICVRSRMAGRDCKDSRLRRSSDGIYQGSVGLARHFDIRPRGRYAVTWTYGGSRIGKKLHFTK